MNIDYFYKKNIFNFLLISSEPATIQNINQVFSNLKQNLLIESNYNKIWNLFNNTNFHLILIEPDAISIEWKSLIENFRFNSITKDIPILLIYSSNPEILKLVIKYNVTDFLIKPFSELEFLASVKNSLELVQLKKNYNEAEYKISKLEKELNYEQEAFNYLSKHIPIGILIFQDTKITFTNIAALSILKAMSPNDVLRTTIDNYFSTQTIHQINSSQQGSDKDKVLNYLNVELKCLDNSINHIKISFHKMIYMGKKSIQIFLKSEE